MNVWFGVVENRNDPLKLGRCQVRIFNNHSDNLADIPSEDLPWALATLPLNAGKEDTPNSPVEGTHVVGVFLDDEKQVPMMLGVVGGEYPNVSSYTKGFCDQRKDRSGSPRIPLNYNSGVLQEDKESPQYPGKTGSMVPEIARGITDIIKTARNQTTQNIKMSGGGIWSQPETTIKGEYPYTNSKISESGNAFIVDDSISGETLLEFHRTGTFKEKAATGDQIEKVVRDLYEIVLRNANLFVNGNESLTVGGNLLERIDQNLQEEIGGSASKRIQQNDKVEVGSNQNNLVANQSIENIGTLKQVDAPIINIGAGATEPLLMGNVTQQWTTNTLRNSIRSMRQMEALCDTLIVFLNSTRAHVHGSGSQSSTYSAAASAAITRIQEIKNQFGGYRRFIERQISLFPLNKSTQSFCKRAYTGSAPNISSHGVSSNQDLFFEEIATPPVSGAANTITFTGGYVVYDPGEEGVVSDTSTASTDEVDREENRDGWITGGNTETVVVEVVTTDSNNEEVIEYVEQQVSVDYDLCEEWKETLEKIEGIELYDRGVFKGTTTGYVVDAAVISEEMICSIFSMKSKAKEDGIKLYLTSGIRPSVNDLVVNGRKYASSQRNIRISNLKNGAVRIDDNKYRYLSGEIVDVMTSPSNRFEPFTAVPGYSKHQSGIAVDIAVKGNRETYRWLVENAKDFGFVRTVSTERWHWEYRPNVALQNMFAFVQKESPSWDGLVYSYKDVE